MYAIYYYSAPGTLPDAIECGYASLHDAIESVRNDFDTTAEPDAIFDCRDYGHSAFIADWQIPGGFIIIEPTVCAYECSKCARV